MFAIPIHSSLKIFNKIIRVGIISVLHAIHGQSIKLVSDF